MKTSPRPKAKPMVKSPRPKAAGPARAVRKGQAMLDSAARSGDGYAKGGVVKKTKPTATGAQQYTRPGFDPSKKLRDKVPLSDSRYNEFGRMVASSDYARRAKEQPGGTWENMEKLTNSQRQTAKKKREAAERATGDKKRR